MSMVRVWVGCLLLAFGSLAAVAAEPQSIRIVMVGDIMLADGPGKVIGRGEDPFAPCAELFRGADYRIANLECVIATRGAAVKKPWTFRAHPRCAALVAKHFDAVSLANNHTGDYGPDAFVEQLDLLKAAKVPQFGGGRNKTEAHQPLVIDVKGIRIALLGYNEFKPRSFAATDTQAGCAWSEDELVLADIAAARQKHKADLVIPYMHWGWEHEPGPNDRQRALSRKMIDAGADVVVGGHPHCWQGTEKYRDKLIVYSLGNYVFDGFERPSAKLGWVLRMNLNRKGLVSWDVVTVNIDDEGVPRLAKESPKQ